MEEEAKAQVIVPLDEYNDLLKDREKLMTLFDEVKKSKEEQGFLVIQTKTTPSTFFGHLLWRHQCLDFEIQKVNDLVNPLIDEIVKLKDICLDYDDERERLKKKVTMYERRNWWQRLFNINPKEGEK